jgi:excisionase family DNA binding protein
MPRDAESAYLSTAQASQALGVGISTIKRWVDEGVLPAHRTAGGHRKLLRADVLALAREGGLPRHDLARLILPSHGNKLLEVEDLPAPLLAALLRGDAEEVGVLIRSAYRSGVSLETLADRVVAPVMHKVGHQWETARIDVWREHRATQLCTAALYQLQAELQQRVKQPRQVAVGGTPEGDAYQLATLLAQLVLLDADWAAFNLGPNTPFNSLAKALRELRPRLIWLSVTHLEDARQFIAEYRAFYREAERAGTAVAVGGQALSDPIRSQIPYTSYGDRMKHLAAFARTLYPRPGRPPRGRPRKS